MSDSPPPTPKPRSLSTRAFNTFLGLFLLLAWVYLALGIRQAVTYLGSGDWVRVDGVVEKSEVVEKGRIRTRPSLALRYRYWVDDETYTGTQVAFDDQINPRLHRRGPADEVIERYPVGSLVSVYYSPNDPGVAVLERAFRWQAIPALLLAILVGIGAIRMVFSNVLGGWLMPPRSVFSLEWTRWDRRLFVLGVVLLIANILISFMG